MGLTIAIEDNPSIRVTDKHIQAEQQEQVWFVVEGVVTMTEQLLNEFAGKALKPSQLELVAGTSRTIEIDFEQTTLQLEAVDVGVQTPEMGDSSTDLADRSAETDPPHSSADDDGEPTEEAGVIAFTVEGVIRDVSEQTVESLVEDPPKLKAITFDVDESALADGGSDDGPLFEVTLLGYTLTVRRDGTVVVGTDTDGASVGLS